MTVYTFINALHLDISLVCAQYARGRSFLNTTELKVKKTTSVTKNPVRKVADTLKTTCGLRDTLFLELDSVRRGQSTPQQSSVVARIAAQIINSARLDLEYQAKMKGRDTSVPKPVLLGSA